MTEHLNAKLYRRAIAAFQERDLDTMKGLIAADCLWHEAGNPEPVRGREAIIERFAGRTGEMDADVRITEIVADDRTCMVLLDVTFTRGTDSIHYEVIERGHIEDGMLVERWAYMDAVPDEVADFFA